jgi:hypothetical protein
VEEVSFFGDAEERKSAAFTASSTRAIIFDAFSDGGGVAGEGFEVLMGMEIFFPTLGLVIIS